MSRFAFVLLFILLMVVPAAAQRPETPSAEKVDEFGPLSECDFRGRIDALLSSVSEKDSVQGYIIVYQGTNQLPAAYDDRPQESVFRNHLRFRNFPTERVTIVAGGFRERFAAELWLVPTGAAPPQPTGTIARPPTPTDRAYLYDRNGIGDESYGNDEFLLPSVIAAREAEATAQEEPGDATSESAESAATDEPGAENPAAEEPAVEEPAAEGPTPAELEDMKFQWANERFGEALKKHSNARGALVFYADDLTYDIEKLRLHVEAGRRRIAAAAKLAPATIEIVFGGYREYPQVDFWILPAKIRPPAPTPAERTPQEREENQ